MSTPPTAVRPMPSTARGDDAPRGGLAASASRLFRRPELGALAGLVIVFAFFAVAGKHGFLTHKGTSSWLNTASELGVVAIPVGLLMIAGHFDLSIGSVIGASSMMVAIGSGVYSWPIWVAIIAALALGATVGLVNGVLVTKTGLPSFIVTIATMFIVAGLALGLSRATADTTAVSYEATGAAHTIFGSKWNDFNVSIVWCLAIAVVTTWTLTQTRFGNWIFATGGDVESARAKGVPTGRVTTSLFVMSGTAAALVGVIQTALYAGGNVTNGQDFVFAAPMAAVIGGVLLTGGYGSAIGVLMGSMIYGIVQLGVFYTGWDTDWAQLVLGLLLLAAVLGNNYFRRLALRGGVR
jgi:simple sugar transport system permease protein